jgi:hypothetical protein
MSEDEFEEPFLPYGGTSGWSGSEASEDRAERDDADGTTSERQRAVLLLLARAGAPGLTWFELAEIRGWHHGQASGALSVLHKVGRISRLAERRGDSHVYVLPNYVLGRDESPYRNRRTYTEGYQAGWRDALASGEGA